MGCGHIVSIRKREAYRERYLCQTCTGRKLAAAERKYAHDQMIMVDGRPYGLLPSWHPQREKTLYFRRKIANIELLIIAMPNKKKTITVKGKRSYRFSKKEQGSFRFSKG